MTDPEWERMLIARTELHIGDLFRELASTALVTTSWEQAQEVAGRLAEEYATRIVRDLIGQFMEGYPSPDPRTIDSLRRYGMADPREEPT
jgi:hypothetical protein